MKQVLEKLTSPRRAMLLLLLLALFFNWPYLMGGFQGDDFILINLIEQENRTFSRWLGVWSVNEWPGYFGRAL